MSGERSRFYCRLFVFFFSRPVYCPEPIYRNDDCRRNAICQTDIRALYVCARRTRGNIYNLLSYCSGGGGKRIHGCNIYVCAIRVYARAYCTAFFGTAEKMSKSKQCCIVSLSRRPHPVPPRVKRVFRANTAPPSARPRRHHYRGMHRVGYRQPLPRVSVVKTARGGGSCPEVASTGKRNGIFAKNFQKTVQKARADGQRSRKWRWMEVRGQRYLLKRRGNVETDRLICTDNRRSATVLNPH